MGCKPMDEQVREAQAREAVKLAREQRQAEQAANSKGGSK